MIPADLHGFGPSHEQVCDIHRSHRSILGFKVALQDEGDQIQRARSCFV